MVSGKSSKNTSLLVGLGTFSHRALGTRKDIVKVLSQLGPDPGITLVVTGAVIAIFIPVRTTEAKLIFT